MALQLSQICACCLCPRPRLSSTPSSAILLLFSTSLAYQTNKQKSKHVNLNQFNYGEQVNQSQANKSQLKKSQHKKIENKDKEEGLEASLLVVLLVILLGRSFIALQ